MFSVASGSSLGFRGLGSNPGSFIVPTTLTLNDPDPCNTHPAP